MERGSQPKEVLQNLGICAHGLLSFARLSPEAADEGAVRFPTGSSV